MNYNTYVISLKDEVSRRDSIHKQLEKIKEGYKFIDAVDFRLIDNDELKKHIKSESSASIKRAMTKGEVGCALSHMKCYSEFVSSNNTDWAWILEDDADILERVNENTIRKVISLTDGLDVDVIILGYSKLLRKQEKIFYKMEPLKVFNQCKKPTLTIGTPWRNWTCGTVSYLIRKKGAEKFLAYFHDFKVSTVADDWNFFENSLSLKIVHCRPILVFEDFINFQSSLEQERKLVSKKKMVFLDFLRILRGRGRRLIMKIGG